MQDGRLWNDGACVCFIFVHVLFVCMCGLGWSQCTMEHVTHVSLVYVLLVLAIMHLCVCVCVYLL